MAMPRWTSHASMSLQRGQADCTASATVDEVLVMFTVLITLISDLNSFYTSFD